MPWDLPVSWKIPKNIRVLFCQIDIDIINSVYNIKLDTDM